ncbi:ABC transporter substrate-binding protein [Streptomyces corynorhini]|uniref:Sugar ABC transporter substrate-binding protein n=1 Tax=Streptomyces corynorhini TaxID=2282652 RepID=A0A370B156_9ACTN|nr:sugar ABC transporter substrate-binding protein [Streptomyces corynorhini]RDG35627.1 sugar ABC transporter substrate-binding protein [Streptomyces corynorhini]
MLRRSSRGPAALAAAVALSLLAVGCGTRSPTSAESSHTVTYWLWDANQLPGYQECAQGFEKRNPGLKVDISQIGWDDYWTKLTASMIAGTEPDVFTDHITKFAQFIDLDVLAPLDELPATRGIEDTYYQPGLAAAWIAQDGHRYGSPKDWDTIAMYYNKKLTEDAGISDDTLNSLAWNPTDGGTFERTIAHLTVDTKGRRGDEPGFDRHNVKTYGLATNDAGEANGQTQWSAFTASAGWNYTDKKAWGTHYNYDDPVFQSTVEWYFGLAEKGYLAPFEAFSKSNGPDVQLGSGRAALALHGSWMAKTYYGLKGIETGSALTPVGPSGKRATMLNGLADSLTRRAGNKPAAQKWVAYLASDACQRTVGTYGVVFPASKAGTEVAIAAYEKAGIDVTAFTRPVADGTTFSYPITDYAADVAALMKPAMQDVYANGKPVGSLTKTNSQINLILSQGD